MATTDARTGFRLPWSSDPRPDDDTPETDGADAQSATPENPHTTETSGQAVPGADREETTMTELTATETAVPVEATGSEAPKPVRRPSKFLADLTKAMQTAAEAAREESVSRLQADAKAAIEEIHGRSSTEAGDLRRRADDDVSAIREWSKQEIARIREQTETKVADRKAHLEREIEEHAAFIERHIDRVQGRVTSFEAEMATFFERLLAEDDPTRFAEMAESLPEPPPFDGDSGIPIAFATAPAAEAVETADAAAELAPEAETPSLGVVEAFEEAPETQVSEAAPPELEARATVDALAEDAESAMAAIQAAAEAADTTGSAVGPQAEATHEPEFGSGEGRADDSAHADPRLAAFGLSADFAAAEAEAAAAVDTADEAEEIPVIADEALAARLAGLVPADGRDADGATSDTKVTQVVVTGLVSVASIASFKRHLGRMAGVNSVGVSSGPEGEFIFAVSHGPDLVLRDAVPAMPGFQARVTGGEGNTVEVIAHDPESEA